MNVSDAVWSDSSKEDVNRSSSILSCSVACKDTLVKMLKMEECEFSTSQLMSLFLKFWNEAAKLLGDLPCNTFTLQPLGCTLAYTQAQVKVEGIL